MKKIFFLLVLALFGFGVCEAQTKAKTKKTKQGRISWRLKLDFISKGSGIDNTTYDKIMAFAGNHAKKPTFNVLPKGKEGEKQVYFGLAELTEDEQYDFIDEVGKMIPDRKMVRLESTLPKRKAVKAVGVSTVDVAGQPEAPVKYRFVVSFISKGAGPDNNARKQVLDLIQKQAKPLAYEARIWGREGEEDFIFNLKDVSA